uniref:Fibronectin type-III domain-containing protein n=1 Tax=SAR86 cluster bacterium TaxID=2030880 RepID=A0A2A4XET0_9GAMM
MKIISLKMIDSFSQALCLCLLIFCNSTIIAAEYDDFHGSEIDPDLWNIFADANESDKANAISLSDGFLHADIPASLRFVNLTSTRKFTGDVEFVLDFRDFHSNATTFSGGPPSLALSLIWENQCLLVTIYQQDHQNYVGSAYCNDPNGSSIPTEATSGLLIISRIGSTITSYYDTGAGPLPLGSFSGVDTSDVNIGIEFQTGANGSMQVSSDYLIYEDHVFTSTDSDHDTDPDPTPVPESEPEPEPEPEPEINLSPPGNLTSLVDGSSLSFSWSEVNDAEGYRLYYGVSPSLYIGSVDLNNVTSIAAENVTAGSYYVVISAYSGNSESDFSNEVNVLIEEVVPIEIVIPPPENFAVSIDGDTITLSWSAVESATDYELFYGVSSNEYLDSVLLGNLSLVTIPGVPNGTYFLAIVTHSEEKASELSSEISFSVLSFDLDIVGSNSTSVVPGELLTIFMAGSDYDPDAELSIVFSDSEGFSIEVPSIDATSNSVKVSVPPFSHPLTGEIGSGTVDVQVVQIAGAFTFTTNRLAGLQIADLPSFDEPVGTRTVAYLEGAIQLLRSSQEHQTQLETLAGGELSNSVLDNTVSELIGDYSQLKFEIETIIADPSSVSIIAQIAGETLQLDIDSIAEIDRLVGALTQQDDNFFGIEGLTQTEALDRAEQIGGFVTSISSTLIPLFNGDIQLQGFEDNVSIHALSASDLTCIVSFPKKLATTLFVVQTLRPTAITFYADLDKVTALDGVNTHEVYGALLSRMVLKFAPTIIDTIVPCVGTALDAAGVFNIGPDAYDAYLREVQRQSDVFAAGFRAGVLPETRESGLCLLNSALCEDAPVTDPSTTEPPTTEPPTTEPPPTEPPTTTSPYQGSFSGGWSGLCVNASLGTSQNVSGTLSLGIGSDGSFSGSFSGSDSGAVNGNISNTGNFATTQGSAGDASWIGTIARSGDSLSGGGSWSSTFQLAGTVNCNGTWSGSGAIAP